jgi:peptide/nickel transport system ATP-binding protein
MFASVADISRSMSASKDVKWSLDRMLKIKDPAGPYTLHKLTNGDGETRATVREALDLVNLSPVEDFAERFPSDLSGGQKQRAAIARAIIVGPDLLVADEPVSMLDMSVRAKILDLMIDLKNRLGLTYVYVTHDLATAKFLLRPGGDHVPGADRGDRDRR